MPRVVRHSEGKLGHFAYLGSTLFRAETSIAKDMEINRKTAQADSSVWETRPERIMGA